MPAHDTAHLEARIKHVVGLRAKLAGDPGWDELLQVIHRPGWTTPAEHTLVLAAVEHLATQLEALTTFQSTVLQAGRQVGQTG